MLNLTELHKATLIMDIAAVFLLAGIIVYTSIYRRRDRREDRLFFSLNVLTIVMAISDGITYVLDGSKVTESALISLICNNIFFLTFEAFCGLLALYLYQRVCRNTAVTRRTAGLLLFPAALMIVMVIANQFVPFLFYVDSLKNEYTSYPLYNIIFIGPAFYALLAVWAIAKIDKGMIWLFVLLLVLRLFLGNILRGVSSTALIFAVGLVFVHIHAMGVPFYEEEVQ